MGLNKKLYSVKTRVSLPYLGEQQLFSNGGDKETLRSAVDEDRGVLVQELPASGTDLG